MSYQQDSNYGSYSNYGGYSEDQLGSSGGGGGVDSAAYDMFDNAASNAAVDPIQQETSSSGFGPSTTSAFYAPSSYNQHPPQQQQQQQQQHQHQPQQPQAAYRPSSRQGPAHHRGPTPPNTYPAGPSSATSSGMFPGGNAAGAGMLPEQLLGNPMVTGMAMQYGQDMVGRGGEEIKKNLDKYMSIGQLKYYFAVDTSYVAKKLGLLLFPFTRTDWAIKYNQDEPVQPKYDVNAPDLYIPTMAYSTYVLLVGYILGMRNAFSPDLLATTASSALVWLILEIGIIYLTLTVMSINTSLTKWDILSFSSYKYVGINVVLVLGLMLNSMGYYIVLAYVSVAFIFFLLRTLKLRIEPEVHGMQVHGKRKLYIILMYAILQPMLIWWMTFSLVPNSTVELPEAPAETMMPFQDQP